MHKTFSNLFGWLLLNTLAWTWTCRYGRVSRAELYSHCEAVGKVEIVNLLLGGLRRWTGRTRRRTKPPPSTPTEKKLSGWTESPKASPEYVLTRCRTRGQETRATFRYPVDLGNKVGVLRGLKHMISFFFKPFTEGWGRDGSRTAKS